MTTDPTLAPTDVEIDALWRFEASKNWGSTLAMRTSFARAVLARWGQPAHGGEPVAWLYTTPMPDGSTFVGASSERLQIGIGVTPGTIEQPLFTAPQPVEREPLTEAQVQALIEAKHYRPGYELKASDQVCLDWYRLGLRDGEAAHGIKGGPHGAE